MPKYVLILLTVLFLGISQSCTTSKPDININYSSQDDRPDWKDKIDRGEIGFYNMTHGDTFNLDSPPHLKGQTPGNIPEPEMTESCREFISQKDKRLSKIEFVVDEEGYTDRFYVLESAGPCDDLLANIYNKNVLAPGIMSGQAITTLVHVEYRFTNR